MLTGIGIIGLVCIFQLLYQNSIIHKTQNVLNKSFTQLPKRIVSQLANEIRNSSEDIFQISINNISQNNHSLVQHNKTINKQELDILNTFSSGWHRINRERSLDLMILSFYTIILFCIFLVPPIMFYIESNQVSEIVLYQVPHSRHIAGSFASSIFSLTFLNLLALEQFTNATGLMIRSTSKTLSLIFPT
jgi:hypothetical protein